MQYNIPKGEDENWRHSSDYTDALKNLGRSIMASPDGNVKVLGPYYYNTDGTYGIIDRSNIIDDIRNERQEFKNNPKAYGWAN